MVRHESSRSKRGMRALSLESNLLRFWSVPISEGMVLLNSLWSSCRNVSSRRFSMLLDITPEI